MGGDGAARAYFALFAECCLDWRADDLNLQGNEPRGGGGGVTDVRAGSGPASAGALPPLLRLSKISRVLQLKEGGRGAGDRAWEDEGATGWREEVPAGRLVYTPHRATAGEE
jgi:hypothetical protein